MPQRGEILNTLRINYRALKDVKTSHSNILNSQYSSPERDSNHYMFQNSSSLPWLRVRITTPPHTNLIRISGDGVPGSDILSKLPLCFCWIHSPGYEPLLHWGISRCRPTFSPGVCILGWKFERLHYTEYSGASRLGQKVTQKPWLLSIPISKSETLEKHKSTYVCWQC